jgi:uncharacterized protein YegL
MRKLPVYLLLDTSGSMNGEPIEAVKNGIALMMSGLRQNPQAIETVYLSVITFDSTARQVMPLTDVVSFQQPEFKASGTTALGEALDLVSRCIDREVAQTTPDRKGDWKPIVFLFTDGVPTDDWRKGLDQFRQRKTAYCVACVAGNKEATPVLKEITPNVLSLATTDSHGISRFFTWVTASIAATSVKIEDAGIDLTKLKELPPPPAELNIVV